MKLIQVSPRIVPTPENWQLKLAKVLHLALYLLMFVMPVLGWLVLSGEGKDILFFGLSLPPLISENKEVAGITGYVLITIHAIAALVHHYVLKDNTLLRILPGRH